MQLEDFHQRHQHFEPFGRIKNNWREVQAGESQEQAEHEGQQCAHKLHVHGQSAVLVAAFHPEDGQEGPELLCLLPFPLRTHKGKAGSAHRMCHDSLPAWPDRKRLKGNLLSAKILLIPSEAKSCKS